MLNREIQAYANEIVNKHIANDPPSYAERSKIMLLLRDRFPAVQRSTLTCAFGRAMRKRRIKVQI